MIQNREYWLHYFEATFSSHIRAFLQATQTKILPAFDSIAHEAESVADAEYSRLGHLPGDEYSDMADAAESASEEGLIYYQVMSDVQQGLLNILVVSLYHLFEQQLLYFYRSEVLSLSEENDAKLFDIHKVKRRLFQHGIDFDNFQSWPKIYELRLVANTVKHAEGKSSQELQALRPDLFVHPSIQSLFSDFTHHPSSIYAPLAGHDFFVRAQDVRSYGDSILEFWAELGAAI